MDTTDGGEMLEVVIMVTGAISNGDVNPGGVVNPNVGGGVGQPELTDRLVSSPIVVIMVTGAKTGRGVNPGGVINPDNGDGAIGLLVLITDGGGLVSSTISNDESLLLRWLGVVVVVGELLIVDIGRPRVGFLGPLSY